MAISKEELVKGLNQDLSFEYQAVITYLIYAASVSGIHRSELKSFFEQEVPEELRHAQFLANKIAALGGVPGTMPAEVPSASNEHQMLENVRQSEADTIKRYVTRMRQAEEYGDYGLANDLQDIISDETTHKEETEKLLRGLGRE